MPRILTLCFIVLLFALSAHAESRYVTNQILIALRPVQNDTADPLEYLPTGMRVEVIEDLGAFLKIKSASGKIGFARSKYFITTPPQGATTVTAGVNEQLAAALKRTDELSAEVERLKSTPQEVAKTEDSPQGEKNRVELVEILRERDELKKEVARLKEATPQNIPSSTALPGSQLQWFLAGAAILLLGWFAGKSSHPKRRY